MISELMQNVTKEPYTDCWIWLSTSFGGYGTVSIKNKSHWVHKYFYENLVGEVPKGMELDHLCKNRICCNPDHLEIVTPAQNSQRSKNTKLSWDKVDQIRRLYFIGQCGYKELAQKFQVAIPTIVAVITGRTWKV